MNSPRVIDAIINGVPARVVLDVGSDEFLAGFLSGGLWGIDRGRELEAAEGAAVHHQAWLSVQAAARLPEHEELERRRKPTRPEWLDPAAPWPYVPRIRSAGEAA